MLFRSAQSVVLTLQGSPDLSFDLVASVLSSSTSSSTLGWAPLMVAAGELAANMITPYSVTGGDFTATMPAAAVQDDTVGLVEAELFAGTLTLDAGPGRTIVNTQTGAAAATCPLTGDSGGGPRTVYFKLDGTVWRMSIANPFIV